MIFFDTHDDESILVESSYSFNFVLPHDFDLLDSRSVGIGTTDFSLIIFTLFMTVVEYHQVENISTKVTDIRYLFLYFLDMILVLFFLGDKNFSWIHGSLGIFFQSVSQSF